MPHTVLWFFLVLACTNLDLVALAERTKFYLRMCFMGCRRREMPIQSAAETSLPTKNNFFFTGGNFGVRVEKRNHGVNNNRIICSISNPSAPPSRPRQLGLDNRQWNLDKRHDITGAPNFTCSCVMYRRINIFSSCWSLCSG